MTLKIAVVAPIPSASVKTASTVKPGVRSKVLAATRNVFTKADNSSFLAGKKAALLQITRLAFSFISASSGVAFLRNFFC
jgi:hypothetical protein